MIASDGTHTASAAFSVIAALTLSPSKGFQGQTLKINGTGFGASDTVSLTWTCPSNTCTKALPSGTAGSTGSFSVTTTVPAGTPGTYTIKGTGATSGATASASFTHIPHLVVSPTSGLPGSKATVSGTGFASGQPVTVKWNCGSASCTSTTVLGTSQATDSNGDFGGSSSTPAVSVTIPSSSTGGFPVGGKDTSGNFAKATFTVT